MEFKSLKYTESASPKDRFYGVSLSLIASIRGEDFLVFVYGRRDGRTAQPTDTGQFPHQGHNLTYFSRGPLDDATCHV